MKHAGLKLVLILVLMAALAAAAWMFLKPVSKTTFRLPNGVIVRYLGTARAGTTFRTTKPWHRLARQALPTRWQYWIPQDVNTTAVGPSNSVTVFWDVIDPSGAPLNGAPWRDYAAEDEEGNRFERGGGYSSYGGSSRSVFALQLRGFPRRQPSFRFLFLDRTDAVLQSVLLPNPIPGPFPEWTPDRLPINRTNGPVELTLAGLTEQLGSGQRRYVRPNWQITSNDPWWTNARPAYFQCEDATGNEGQFLSLKEPAWKIRTWVHRQRSADFTDAERLVLTNLAIPGPGEFEALDVAAARAGVSLNVQCLAGAGTLFITNGTSRGMSSTPRSGTGWSTSSDGKTRITSWGSLTPFFLVEADGVKSHDEIRFRVTDERGRELELDKSSGSYGTGRTNSWSYKRGFTPPEDAKLISLEIIVSHPREFEFTINPDEIKRAPAAAK